MIRKVNNVFIATILSPSCKYRAYKEYNLLKGLNQSFVHKSYSTRILGSQNSILILVLTSVVLLKKTGLYFVKNLNILSKDICSFFMKY